MSARRFYTLAAATAENGVALDGKPVRTPGKAALILPSAALAAAVAAEWQAQGPKLKPLTMPLTKLANTAIDKVRAARAGVVAEMVSYAGTDLTCYRAAGPEPLRRRQSAAWDPVLAWALVALDAQFNTTESLIHRTQSVGALAAVEAELATHDEFALSALWALTMLTGSALLALMLEAGAITADAAWAAAHVDEDWQAEQWGADAEAAAKRASARAEFDAAAVFLRE